MRSSRPIALAGALSLGALAFACATNPVTGHKEVTMMTEAQEIEMGRQAAADVERQMPRYGDERLQRYISDIGLRMARSSERPNLPWQFTVVDVAAVNAFALPGGFIYITRGILPYLNDESELAGVLGHEIGHVTARHSVRQYTKSAAGEIGLITLGIFVPSTQPFSGLAGSGLNVFFLKYGREDEIQADGLGARYAAENGWDPKGIGRMLTTLSRLDQAADRRGIPNWLSTHPNPEARVERVSDAVKTASAGHHDLASHRDDYLRRIDGVTFGDNPDEGIVRDNLFLHPSMRISVAFPLDWPITNGEEQVVAKNPSADQYMVLQVLERTAGTSLDAAAERQMSKAGWHARSRAATRVNGLEAIVGVYDGSASKLGKVTTRAMHIAVGRRVFLLAGVAKPEAFKDVDAAFEQSLHSFRELTSREASDLRPNVVALYTTRQGDSWESIAARHGHLARASTLAIMNGHAVNDQPAPGEVLKVVIQEGADREQ